MLTPYELTADSAAAVTSLDDEPTSRLMAMLDSLPKAERARFLPAAKRAAEALELLVPVMLGSTRSGLVAGLYAAIERSDVAVVIAGPRTCRTCVVRIADLQPAMEKVLEAIRDDVLPRDCLPGALPLMVEETLKQREISGGMLGALVSHPVSLAAVQGLAEMGVAPAIIALLSRDRRGCLRIQFPMALHLPADTLERDGSGA